MRTCVIGMLLVGLELGGASDPWIETSARAGESVADPSAADPSAAPSAAPSLGGESVMLFDFRAGPHGWEPTHAVENMRVTADGLEFDCVGPDPYIQSEPVTNLPLGTPLRLTIRMRSEADASGEVFFGRGFTAGNSTPFSVRADGQWHEYDVQLPPQQAGARLRIDPAADVGRIAIAWIRATDLRPLDAGQLARPERLAIDAASPGISAGELTIVHAADAWDGYVVRVDDQQMAQAHGRAQLGVVLDGQPVYVDLADTTVAIEQATAERLSVAARVVDAGGANWLLRRTFTVRAAGAITVETSVAVDRERAVCHLPMLTLSAGLGSFGESKTQAVLPGVEYLEDEPSSSEADVRGPQAQRRIVDSFRPCFPLMSVVANGRYVGLIWDRSDRPATVFDSPDRVFGSKAHLLGLWLPGGDEYRLENELNVFRPLVMAPDRPVCLTATLIGGRGQTVQPAVEQYVRLRGGLPPAPDIEGGFDAAVKLLAHGWLDSALHEDGIWRHAVWGKMFPARPAADALGYMLWLAEHTDDRQLAERLRAAAQRGLARLAPAHDWDARCSHVARPFAPLLFGQIEPYAQRRLDNARQAMAGFDNRGLVRYRPLPGHTDYGATHWEDHANGLSATRLEPILETAVFTGDAELTRAALAVLDQQLEAYRDTVPRGAQTWEMPLHTPDILASGRVVAGCNLAYCLTGERRYLEAAREWAWSGVPLVYLDPPVAGSVGLYATTAVLGASNWVAPFWIGQPVQWCGLVYRTAVQELGALDPDVGPFWNHLAAGITRSGLQQTFPSSDRVRQGLLPDFFHLREQRRDGPAISPGTVQANLAEAFGKTPIYSLRRLAPHGVLLHVPGGIGRVADDNSTLQVEIDGWCSKPYWVRLVHIPSSPKRVEFEGGQVLDVEFNAARQTLNIRVEGKGTLRLSALTSTASAAGG